MKRREFPGASGLDRETAGPAPETGGTAGDAGPAGRQRSPKSETIIADLKRNRNT